MSYIIKSEWGPGAGAGAAMTKPQPSEINDLLVETRNGKAVDTSIS